MSKRLFFISPKAYNSDVFGILKGATRTSKGVYYVTLNKTSSSIVDLLKESGIDPRPFHFLDAVTPHLLTIRAKPNCDFTESIDDLTLLAERILIGVRSSGADTFVLDSISSLLVYKDARSVLAFMNYVVPFLERMGVGMIFFTLTEDEHKPAMEQIKMMVDESTASKAQGSRKMLGLRSGALRSRSPRA